MNKSGISLIIAIALVVLLPISAQAGAVDTAFTYQGRLIDTNNAADGLYDFQFKLFDAVSGGNALPTVSVTSPLSGDIFYAGDDIVIEANASDGDGNVTKVEFYQGSTKLGEDTSAPYSYVWNDVNAGQYSLTARATDNNGATKTSAAVNISVISGNATGYILREWWTGITGTAVSSLTSDINYPTNPNGRELITTLEAPTDWADNYGTRIRGYLYPPADGNYTFWIASDANSELWLSTDDNSANASLTAYVRGSTNSREWTKYPSQQSSLISLTAGQKYYVEVLQKEGSGNDNVAVAWGNPNEQVVIDGVYLSPCCLDFRDFARFGNRWGRYDCDAANDWCGGFDSDRDGSILLDDLQVFVDSWLAVASGPVSEWITYPGYEGILNHPKCAYDGNIYCQGNTYTGLLLFDGKTITAGGNLNYGVWYLHPFTLIENSGILAQTSTGELNKLEYSASPASINFTDVTPSNFISKAPGHIHRAAVECLTYDVNITPFAHYRFDEANGTGGAGSIIDSSYSGTHLTPAKDINSVPSAHANMGQGIRFGGDESGEYMVASTSPEPTGDFSVLVWVNIATTSKNKIIYYKNDFLRRQFTVANNTLRAVVAHDGGTDANSRADGAYALTKNTWYFVGMTYSATDKKIRLYKNGTEVAYDPGVGGYQVAGVGNMIQYPDDPLWVGGDVNHNFDFNGVVDNLMFFDRVLDLNEMKLLYVGGRGTQKTEVLRRRVLFFEYGVGAMDYNCNAWFSTNNGTSWTRMWDSNATGVSHFHGAIYDPCVGSRGRLMVMTGDGIPESSLLICDDVCDLLANREVWYDVNHWALGYGARTGRTPDGNYVIGGWDDQKGRACDIVSDGTYAYWIPDLWNKEDVKLYKLNHATKEITTLAEFPVVKGIGWSGLKTSEGDLLFTTASAAYYYSFYSGCDEWVRLYRIRDDKVTELHKWRNSTYNPFVYPVIAPSTLGVTLSWISELNGIIWLDGLWIEPVNLGLLGSASYLYSQAPKVGSIKKYSDISISPITNPVLNPTFDYWNGTDFNNWTKSDANWMRDANVTEGGHLYSARCTVTAGSPYIQQDINAPLYLPLDSFVTVKCKIRVARGADAGFAPLLTLYVYPITSTYYYSATLFSLATSVSSTTFADDTWHEICVSGYVPTGISYVRIQLTANSKSGKKGTVYFSNIRVEKGVDYGHQHF